MTIYLDTNIFLYASDETSAYYPECVQLLSFCRKSSIDLTTSVETIQEIINYSKNIKEIEKGMRIADFVLKVVDQFFPVDPSTIDIYLKQIETYYKPSSRDILHLATCIENDLKIAITYDKDFSKFKDVEANTPKGFLAKYS